ncbi:hypothetical protein [Demequina sp.]|uniref:hypothetical protein n=1 Tax=Demequina sp. TaxID=2050685 RepID=UPI003A8A610C
MSTAPSPWRAAWEQALSDLEMDVAVAEAMLASHHGTHDSAPDGVHDGAPDGSRKQPWSPPQGIGLIPADLDVRARALLERQTRVCRELAAAARLSRRHDKAIAALDLGGPRAPVYVDTPA